MANEKTSAKAPALSEKQVLDYLQKHPQFIHAHPELFENLTPPEFDHGNGVIDFQYYVLENLQKGMKSLKGRYDVLVTSCRDNMSVQEQVHRAVIGLMRARDLEQLLEIITVDLMSLFDVDVVRLSMESEVAEFYEPGYREEHYSGITFIQPGMCDVIMGKDKNVLLCDDVTKKPIPGFSDIFADCAALIQSCAMLRLSLDASQREVVMSFGVRHKNRFHPGQGIELLTFLAEIVEHRLDQCLRESMPQKAF